MQGRNAQGRQPGSRQCARCLSRRIGHHRGAALKKYHPSPQARGVGPVDVRHKLLERGAQLQELPAVLPVEALAAQKLQQQGVAIQQEAVCRSKVVW